MDDILTPADKAELDKANAAFDAADDVHEAEQLTSKPGFQNFEKSAPGRWLLNLPKNIAGGVYKAALNTINTGSEIIGSGIEATAESGGNPATALVKSVAHQVKSIAGEPSPSLAHVAPELWKSLNSFYDEHLAGDGVADDITQGVVQFALPFAVWSRALGVAKGAGAMLNIARAASAEAITVGSAYDPHDGRFADVVELGRQSEGKFGDVLRRVTPDGSLANTYIHYMTDHENEGEWEGRFKNILDNAAVSAATAGVLTAGMKGFKGFRTGLENVVGSADSPALASAATQGGHLGVKVSPSTRPNYVQISVGGKPLVEVAAGTEGELVNDLQAHFSADPVKAAPVANKNRFSETTVEPNHNGQFSDSFRKEHFVMPGSTVVTVRDSAGKPRGLLAMKENEDGALQINNAVVDASARGTGQGKTLLMQAAQYAQSQGKQLVSDSSVTVNQLRVYESLVKQGKLQIEYANPASIKAALEAGDGRMPVKGPGGRPVVKSIKVVGDQ